MSDDNRTETEVAISGVPHTMLLDDDDAARYAEAADAEAANKAAQDDAAQDSSEAGAKSKQPANKSRGAAGK